jgi:hypothetical protein
MERLILLFVIFTSFVVLSQRGLGYAAETQSARSAHVIASEPTARATNLESSSQRRPLFPQNKTTTTVAPGEGLGCFYHQGYYSHLPLFKDGVYTLPGSRDVSEPYQRPLTSPPPRSSSPSENPTAPQRNVTDNTIKQ